MSATLLPSKLARSLPRASHRLFTTSAPMARTQNSLPAAYYRGGTSRAVIFRQEDLPSDRTAWPAIFRGVIGSPDPNGRQLNGIGGGVSSLSKVCVVGPPSVEGADVDYTFAAIGVRDPDVDFTSNCGNMSVAIGPFAVDSGLVKRDDGETVVRIHNTNTGKHIHAKFLVEDGEAISSGDFAIDGVAGTGSKIQLSFVNPAGSKTGKALPTGNVTDTFDGIAATCIDVSNPCVFVQAADLGVEGGILPDAIDSHPDLLQRLDSIRRKASVAMGLSQDEASAAGSIPKIAMVSAPHPHRLLSGEKVDESSCDLVARPISVGQPHRACPLTLSMALATASKLEGSTVHRCTSAKRIDPDGITIGHSSGRLLVGAEFDKNGNVTSATIFSTARRIMEGKIFWK